jgi:hypothetical protein
LLVEGDTVGLRKWARDNMTKRAVTAHERGHNVYVHQVANANGATISRWVNEIESVGWKLAAQTQGVGTGVRQGQMVWTLTFRRVETTGERHEEG